MFINGDILVKHKDDVKAALGRIAYQHCQKKDGYESEEKFVSDLVEKLTDRMFIEIGLYTEELVVSLLKQVLEEK